MEQKSNLIVNARGSQYWGNLLISHPGSCYEQLSRSVILLSEFPHRPNHVMGLQINRVCEDLELSRVMDKLGYSLDYSMPVYRGGNSNPNRMHIVHSLDWSSFTTIRVNSEIGITSDITILDVLSRNVGPEYFRACAGNWQWSVDVLEDQLDPLSDSEIRWGRVASDIKNVFNYDSNEQWYYLWDRCSRSSIDSWFNRVQG